MNIRALVHRFSRVLVLGTLTLPVTGIALESESTLRVQVFPDHYALAGMRFIELTALEAWVEPLSVQGLSLDSCGQAAAKRLVAAVERFYGVYKQGIEIHELDPRGPGCVPQTAADFEYYASDENGRSMLP